MLINTPLMSTFFIRIQGSGCMGVDIVDAGSCSSPVNLLAMQL